MSRPVYLVLAVGLSLVAPSARAATIVIDDADAAGQGLNDPTPVLPSGGNSATTLGGARLAVFQQAASIWGGKLVSAVPIHVSASFAALACTSTSAVLASTGATSVHRDFPSAPLPGTWYPQALANALAGVDLDAADPDVVTDFNAGIGTPGCMTTTTWYLGFDGHPAAGQIDMLSVVLHELSHGLGFQAYDDLATGAELGGLPDVFLVSARQLGANPSLMSVMTDAERVTASESDPNLYWAGAVVDAAAHVYTSGLAGGHVRLYAPATQQAGSSLSHFSTALTPNELMEPVYAGPNHDVTLTTAFFRDLGWPTTTLVAAVPALPGAGRVGLAVALVVVATARTTRRGGRRRPRRCAR